MKNKPLLASLFINVIVIVALILLALRYDLPSKALNLVNPSESTHDYLSNKEYEERNAVFEGIQIQENSVIFIGDSQVHRGPWNEIIKNIHVVNRGINSDTTEGVLNRLDDVIEAEPKEIYLLIGINDLRYEVPSDKMLDNYKEILSRIQENIPTTDVKVVSLLPVNEDILEDVRAVENESIIKANKGIENLVSQYNYQYVDVYSKLTKDGQLDEALTYDGLHLNGNGYEVLVKYISE